MMAMIQIALGLASEQAQINFSYLDDQVNVETTSCTSRRARRVAASTTEPMIVSRC